MSTTPPAVPACLSTPDSAKPGQKGGTLIFEGVESLDEHRRLICDPDGYRPERCLHCGCLCLHAHEFRERTLIGIESGSVETIRCYRCTDRKCRAVWRILPAAVARHLHRAWETVQDATSEPAIARTVPRTTLRRWLGRLHLVATQLTQLLAATAVPVVLAVTDGLSIACRRAALVAALVEGGLLGRQDCLQQLAAWVHRLKPGVRLM